MPRPVTAPTATSLPTSFGLSRAQSHPATIAIVKNAAQVSSIGRFATTIAPGQIAYSAAASSATRVVRVSRSAIQ
jgi:hypothetical protein